MLDAVCCTDALEISLAKGSNTKQLDRKLARMFTTVNLTNPSSGRPPQVLST